MGGILSATGPAHVHQRRSTCRACGGKGLELFLRLGPTPLANSFLAGVDQIPLERKYPLDVFYCSDCSLVQLLDVIDPELLFRNYVYVTGTSETIAAHNASYARTMVDLLGLGAGDLVVEAASNDGSLLGQFQSHGVRTLGVEPAENIAVHARARGIETVARFFNAKLASELREMHGPAKVVIGNNVLAHVDDPRDFLRGCGALLADDGLVAIEVPYVRELIERLEYDTIYHEHLSYFSIGALARLCLSAGLSLRRVDFVPVHGGSVRLYAGRHAGTAELAPEVESWLAQERQCGMSTLEYYAGFADRVAANKQALLGLLEGLRSEGRTVAGYGAPAKGNTLLNYCGIDTRLLPYTVDKSPLKVGLLTPGTHILVLEVGTLLERQPDYVLILAWNFADEIMRQQVEYKRRGGRFIVPIPDPRIV